MIGTAQIRAARALVNWTQADLAKASKISEIAINKLERGVTDPRMSTINAIAAALHKVGIEFLTEDDRVGVTMRVRAIRRK